MDPISGFSIATSDGSSRLPLHATSLERRLAHPAIKYDCAGEPVGKPASSSIWCPSLIRFVAVRGYDTPSVSPRVDPISGFSIGTSDRTCRLPLHVISSGGSLAHPAFMFDCAGEAVSGLLLDACAGPELLVLEVEV